MKRIIVHSEDRAGLEPPLHDEKDCDLFHADIADYADNEKGIATLNISAVSAVSA